MHEQSPDINQGVVREKPEDQGAGDQGMMFGYACRETDDFMPLSIELAHILLQELAEIRRAGRHMKYLRPDSKSQVTIEYDDNNRPVRIDTIVVSTQHDDFISPKDKSAKADKAAEKAMQDKIREDVEQYLIPRAEDTACTGSRSSSHGDFKLFVNPTGKFVIGGPHGDTGLTGRKIIVDTYGGHGAHGGGAFSGKDPSKVDRSAAYAARHIAKNMVAAGVATSALIQVAYAIGIAQTCRTLCQHIRHRKSKRQERQDPHTTERSQKKIRKIFDMRPYAIVERFGLKNPIFSETAKYGHFGRDHYTPRRGSLLPCSEEPSPNRKNGSGQDVYMKKVEFFAWEKLDHVGKIKKEFGLK
ncbi:MAG: methionine adenosyltransferase [Desulfobacterales bacterium]|nr:methionine adenosyltransferase [Desulfobacterales bacterium]